MMVKRTCQSPPVNVPLASIAVANGSIGGLDVILEVACAVFCKAHCEFLIMQPLLFREAICSVQFPL